MSHVSEIDQNTDILIPSKSEFLNKWNEMIGVLGHDSACVRLYWAGDNLG